MRATVRITSLHAHNSDNERGMTRGRHHTHAYHVPELGRKVKRPKVGYETEEAARARPRRVETRSDI